MGGKDKKKGWVWSGRTRERERKETKRPFFYFILTGDTEGQARTRLDELFFDRLFFVCLDILCPNIQKNNGNSDR